MRLRALGATFHGRAGLEILVLGQLLLFGGIIMEGYVAAPHPQAGPGTYAFLGVAAFALALRHWCIITLGDRWTIAIFTLPTPLVTKGPYRFLRHPNYLAVALELLALTLALQLWITLLVAGTVTGVGLLYRIHRENAVLDALSPQ